MPNEYKIKIVKDIEEKFKNSSGLYFTKYTGMNVSQATKLRKSFREHSVEYKISKNTLTKIAAVNAGYSENEISKFLDGQIGIAYADSDPTAPAKIIKKFSNDNDCLEVVGLYFDGTLYDPSKYKELANLPSYEELLTKLVYGLNSPMTKVAMTLNSVMTKLAGTLTSLQENKK